jgi:hypothetical protein
MRRIFESLGAAVLVAVWLTHAARAAEQFALEVPGDPSLSSAALWDGQELTVVDAQGQRFVYLRRPDHDSPDGRFWAYFSPQAGTFLRWPVSGRGPMESGTAVGNRIVWTLSKMQVRALGGPRAAAVNELPKDTGRMHVAAVAFDPQALAVAHIDGAGQLHFYRGLGDRWEHLPSTIRAELLVPGAPVDLLRNADSALPLLYTVGTNGDVYEVVEGRRLRRLIGLEGIAFRPGSDFAVVADNRQKSILMVDSRGRLWELDTTAGHHNLIDKRPSGNTAERLSPADVSRAATGLPGTNRAPVTAVRVHPASVDLRICSWPSRSIEATLTAAFGTGSEGSQTSRSPPARKPVPINSGLLQPVAGSRRYSKRFPWRSTRKIWLASGPETRTGAPGSKSPGRLSIRL